MVDAVPVWSIYKKQCGGEQEKTSWQRAQHRRAVIDYQTEKLACVLEAGGIGAKCGRLKMVGAVTGAVKEIINYRTICFLPSVAKRKRGQMLRDLIYWQENTQGAKFTRYLVITNGALIPIAELGGAIKVFNRKISKWAASAREQYGIDVVFRGLEFPVKPDGRVHLHANILYLPTSRLSSVEWSAFLASVHSCFGTVLRDNGVLKNPREAIKYPFKPNDLDQAADADICELARQTFGARIAEALGSFRGFRRELRESRARTVWDGRELVIARCRERDKDQKPDPDEKKLPKANRLVGILPPMPLFSQWSEPVLLIQGDVETVLATDESLRGTIAEFQQWWINNGAPDVPFNLDNRTLSVLEMPPDKSQIELFCGGNESNLTAKTA